MNIVAFVGMLCAIAFLIPVLTIIICKLAINKSLFALFVHFLFATFLNSMKLGILPVPERFKDLFGIFTCYMYAPLMLITLLFFCTTPRQKKNIYKSLAALVLYEIIIIYLIGFTTESLFYLIGPGLALVLIYSGFLFTYYVKWSVQKNKGIGKTMMITSMVFANGCYAMIYGLYFSQKTAAESDLLLIFYIASFLASTLMSIGLISYNKRYKQIKDIKVTRKELELFFSS